MLMNDLPVQESLIVEFKSDRKSLPDNDIIEAVVGLANTEGGTLYLGIEDNGEVTGLHPNHRDIIRMEVTVAGKTVPSLSVRINIVEEQEYQIMIFEVPKSQSIIATTNGKVLKRRLKANGEPENVPMYPYEFNSRLADLGKLDFSRQPLTNATIEDFDSNEVLRLRKTIELRNGERSLLDLSDEELFKALFLVDYVSGQLVPTVTGLLLLGKEEAIEKYIPTAQSAFQVLEGTQVRINETIRKPLIATFDFFEQMLKPWNKEREMDFGMLRVPIPEFDNRAFREALINAFAHRDYSAFQMTRVQIDDEGMSISNPGGFVSGIDIKNLINADPHGRNPVLADALKRIGLAERTGRGIDRIFEGSIIYGRPLPDYSESTTSAVKVFISRELPDIGFCRMLKEEQSKLGQPFSINQLLILSALRTNKKMSVKDILDVVFIPETRMRTALARLVEIGMIEEFGTVRNKEYLLSVKAYKAGDKSVAYVRQTGIDKVRYPELVLKLVKTKGFIKTKDVEELLHITNRQAGYIIKELIKTGELIKEGKTISTIYKLPDKIQSL